MKDLSKEKEAAKKAVSIIDEKTQSTTDLVMESIKQWGPVAKATLGGLLLMAVVAAIHTPALLLIPALILVIHMAAKSLKKANAPAAEKETDKQ